MLISIHDKTLQRVGFIDNEKPDTLHFYNDTWHRYLTEATSTFDFTVPKTGHASLQFLTEKHYVSFRYEGKDYLFNIMKIEETETELTCYTENLNLELLNEISPAYTAPQAMTFEQYLENGDIVGIQDLSDVVLGINEVSDYSRTLSWEGTETKLARLLSLVNKFDAECEFVTELNRDGSLKHLVLNVYKKHDDDHQGVGTRRQDVTLYYGKSIKSVRRTVDKTELYSAIRPRGKDDLTIASIEKTEYDEDGKVLFYTHSGSDTIYAPQTAEEYPTQISTDGDKWIVYRYEYDTDNVNTLYGQALAKLKDISQPALTYEIEGTYDLAIGDMVIIHDDKFTPTLLLEARVSEQEISFTNPSQNKNIYSNFKALENQLSTDITSRLDEIRAEAAPYTAEILTDNGMFFKNGEGTTTLTARIMRAGNDVTSQVALQWTKDGTPVSTNASITITAEQVPTKANYRLTVKNAGGTVLCTAEVTIARVDDGEDGEGIQSVDMEYCQSDSETTPPANNDPGWSTNPPTRLDGKHVWQRTVITYTSGMEITTTPICITGQQGKDGVSATAIEEEYYLSLSNTEQVGGSWTLTCPEWQNGHYIWTRSKISWSNGDTTYTTPVLAGGLNSANSNASNAQNTANNALGQVEAAVIRVGNLEADNVTINGKLTAAEAAITKLQADIAEVGDLSAINAEIENLKAQDVTITGRLDAVDASIDNLEADIANIGDLSAITADIGELKADVAEIDTALVGKADIDLANIKDGCITTAMIGTGVIGTTQIADGSITDAKIVGLTANKITAGTLDAATIEVVNLNAANITVGTINGQQIAPGAIDMDKLASSVSGAINTATSTANNAMTAANGKNKIYYQTTQPGTTGNKVGDTWFDTDAGYKIYTWDGSKWNPNPLGSAALADDSVTLSKVAADLQGFLDSIDDKADAAQTSADGKNTVFYQTSQPSTSGRKTGDTWFDTDDGYKIYRFNGSAWVATAFGANAIANGAVSESKIATAVNNKISEAFENAGIAIDTAESASNDASTAKTNASTALSTANTAKSTADAAKTNAAAAQSKADSAYSLANTANSAASAAQTTANGKNTVFYQTSAPSTSGRKTNDIWFDTDDGNRMYYWNGSAWTARQFGTNAIANAAITNALIANLDAAKITSGYIAAARIQAGSLTADKLKADTITASSGVIADAAILTANIANLAVTTAKIANLAVETAKIDDAAVTNAKIANLAVTNAKIADATIQSAKIASLDAGKITSGYIAAARIQAGTITADKLASKSITVGQISDAAISSINALVEVGGRNLVLDSNIDETSKVYGFGGRSLSVDLEVGETYTLSANGRVIDGSGTLKVYVYTPSWSSSINLTIDTDTDTTKSKTFTASVGGKWVLSCYSYLSQNTAGGNVHINWVKLEKGNKATDWTPAPEDVDSSIAENSIANWCYNNNLTYINGAKIYTGTITADKIQSNSLTANQIAANAITASELNAGAVTTDKLAANAVTAGKIAAGTITATQIAANTITGNKIAAGTISATNIASNAITSDKIVAGTITGSDIAAKTITANNMVAGTITAASGIIADATITTAKIADGAITNAKIGSLSADKITTGTLRAVTIQSTNYKQNSAGMKLTLSNGVWDSKNFKIKSDGSVEVSGVFKTVGTGYTTTIEDSTFTMSKNGLDSVKIEATGMSGGVAGSYITLESPTILHNYRMTIKHVLNRNDNTKWSVIIDPDSVAVRVPFEVRGGFSTGFTVNGSVIAEGGVTCDALTVNGKSLLNRTYPVGSIYMSVNSTNPGTLFGGTWVELQGRFLIGRSSSYTNGSTGGASTVTLSQAQMPIHDHEQFVGANSGTWGVREDYNRDAQVNKYTQGGTTGSRGSGSSHSIMPPYLAVYMWKRTA